MSVMTKAVSVFALACAASLPLTAQAQQGYSWGYGSDISANPVDSFLFLGYGVPETDDQQFVATCVLGLNGPFVRFIIGAHLGNLAEGETASIAFSGQGFSRVLPAKVLRETEMLAGVEVVAAPDDPLWQAMIAQVQLTYAVQGQRSAVLGLRGSAGPVREFTEDCAQLTNLRPRGGGGGGGAGK